MSTQQLEHIARQVVEEGFNRGDYSALDDLVSPDHVEHQFGLKPNLEGMKEDIRGLRTAFPDFHLTVEDTVTQGDVVWMRGTARGTHLGSFMGRAPTGRNFAVQVFDSVRIADGKIVEHWGVPDRFHLMAQLGALPSPAR
jgi:predicted ester cyclase